MNQQDSTPATKPPTEETPTSTKSKKPSFPKRSIKRKQIVKSQDPPAKRAKAEFEKKPDAQLVFVTLLYPIFELSTSFTGVPHVTGLFYNILLSRDKKLTELITREEFCYVILISIYYRCLSICNSWKQALIYELSDLKAACQDILIPDIIAQYIETFGEVELSNSAKVIPYIRDIDQMRTLPGFYDPLDLINRCNTIRAAEGLSPHNHAGRWCISHSIIIKYTTAITRVLKNLMNVRPVKYSERQGRSEFLSVFEHAGEGDVESMAIDRIEAYSCCLGAAYRMRSLEQLTSHGFQIPAVFTASRIDPDMVLTKHFVSSLRQ